MKSILVVDDKANLTRMLQDYLSADGYRVCIADNGMNALYTARHEKPDLILLDVMMPQMDGYAFLKTFRQEAQTPVILLTAKHEKDDRLEGFGLGADDYITKPFDLDELSARIKAVLRRSEPNQPSLSVLRVGELELHIDEYLLRQNGQEVSLTPAEYAILQRLMQSPNKVFSREDLLLALESGLDSTERTVDVHIRKLRLKLEIDPSNPVLLETVFGIGYRLRTA
jgi:DNA-binding response OmpR family regulator